MDTQWCRSRIETSLTATPQGAERLDGRSDVINEALAKALEERSWRKRRFFIATRSARITSRTRPFRQQRKHDEVLTSSSVAEPRRQETNDNEAVIARTRSEHTSKQQRMSKE